MTEQKKCSKCNGSGTIPCPACSGSGQKREFERKDSGREIPKIVNCARCHGTGSTTCGACNGRG